MYIDEIQKTVRKIFDDKDCEIKIERSETNYDDFFVYIYQNNELVYHMKNELGGYKILYNLKNNTQEIDCLFDKQICHYREKNSLIGYNMFTFFA